LVKPPKLIAGLGVQGVVEILLLHWILSLS